MAENEYDYQGFIWKDLAGRLLDDLEAESTQPKDTTIDDLANKLELDFDEQMSPEVFESAVAWLDGFDKAVGKDNEELVMPDDPKSTLVFSILGSNFMVMICQALEVKTERVTIEQKSQATGLLREYSKIFMWLGANIDQLKKDVPSVD